MPDGKDNGRSFLQGKRKFFLKKNKWNLVLLAVIFVLGSFFISRKQGYHMDEMLSFELANAEFTPWIVPTQPEGRLEKFVKNEIYGDSFGETCANIAANAKDVLQNRGASKMLSYKADVYEEPVWITAKQFREYLTTDKRDNFNYLSVYFNVKDDNHPPLHFMALHTVSSVFREKISPWMGCGINLVLITGICILLLKICCECRWQGETGQAVCILYACSMAGIATLLLIRMYAMLTFFCVAALYLHLKKRKSGQWKMHNKLLILVTVCGFLTQYYFVIFMLFLAGVTVSYLWKTEKKEILYYGRSMGISAALGLCIFPFSVSDVLYSERGVESVQNLGGGLSGLGERFIRFGQIIKERSLGGTVGAGILLLVLVAALLGLFFERLGQDAELAKVKRVKRRKAEKSRADAKWDYYMTAIPCLGYFLVVVKIAPYYADRYLMPIFPLLALLLGLLLKKSLHLLRKEQKGAESRGWLTALAVLLVLPNLILTTPDYLYQGYHLQEYMAKQYSADVCLCVYEGVGYYQNLMEFTNYRKTLLVKEEELFTRSRDEVLEEEQEIVVLTKNNIDCAAVREYLVKEYGFEPGAYLMRESVHQDTAQIFRKKEKER